MKIWILSRERRNGILPPQLVKNSVERDKKILSLASRAEQVKFTARDESKSTNSQVKAPFAVGDFAYPRGMFSSLAGRR